MPIWTLLHQDDFSGGATEINGSTMSDGVGAWTVPGGNGIVSRSSGQALSAAGTWTDIPWYDSVMSSIGDQASQIKFVDATAGGGPATRWNGSVFYYASRGASTTTLYYGTGYPGTSLGSWSHTATTGETLRLESVGSTHEVFYDGASLGSGTDSNVASGRCGIWVAFNQRCDDFADYYVAATPAPKHILLLGVGG